MKKFIRNKLKSLLNFIEDNFRIKKSPPDIYFDNLAYDCFKLFEKDMKKASVFLKDDEIDSIEIKSDGNLEESVLGKIRQNNAN